MSILAVLLVHAGILAVLLSGFAVQAVRAAKKEPGIITIDIKPPPPPVVEDKVAVTQAPEGAAAPANIKSRATPVYAPKAKIPLPKQTKIIAAEKPLEGNDSSNGATDTRGEGTGAGGTGDGTGSGGQGAGSGGGNTITRAEKIAGRITQRDYPKGFPRRRGVEEVVIVRYTVLPNGRTANCKTMQSSGNAALDASTCQLVEARFRYTPARNASGDTVPDVTGWKQVWWVGKRR